MRVIPLVVAAGLVGCAQPPPMRFAHASANQQTYLQDRCVCIQQAQQNRSGAYVNAYGGSSQSKVVTSRGVFLACMGARGYRSTRNLKAITYLIAGKLDLKLPT